jgi:gamma-glutamylcyclotransferase (GGCT)/AIG2-like uncharacterized protein YtfP
MTIDVAELARVLRDLNLRRRFGEATDAERIVEDVFGASRRLAVYGSLARGEVNHHALSDMEGSWHDATVRGVVYHLPWVDGNVYPGIVLTESAPDVSAQIFTAPALSEHWDRLDAFEGDNYYRALALMRLDGEVEGVANIYELKRPPESGRAVWE